MVEQAVPRKVKKEELVGKTFFFDGCVDSNPYYTNTPSGQRLNFTLLLQTGNESFYDIRVMVDQKGLQEYVAASTVPGRNVALLGKFQDRSNRSADGQSRTHTLVVKAQSIRFD